MAGQQAAAVTTITKNNKQSLVEAKARRSERRNYCREQFFSNGIVDCNMASEGW